MYIYYIGIKIYMLSSFCEVDCSDKLISTSLPVVAVVSGWRISGPVFVSFDDALYCFESLFPPISFFNIGLIVGENVRRVVENPRCDIFHHLLHQVSWKIILKKNKFIYI